MDRIDNKYISDAIDELVGFFGIKESIPNETVLRPLRNDKTKECIEKIADYLGLPIAINLTISNEFESRDLVTTDHAGRATAGITAQVSIPSQLPFYGTSALQGFPIQVKVSGDYQRHSETFVAIMAHELSHVLLHSLWHEEKNNEIYTDLAAMILGFSEVINIGRKVVETENYGTFSQTSTATYGYLSDKQFLFALNGIKKILQDRTTSWNDLKGKTLKKLATYEKQLHLYRKRLYELNKFIKYLDKNPKRKIRKEDVPKVVEVHDPNYIERFASVLRNNEKKLKEVESLYSDRFKHSHHYTTQRLDSLRMFCENLTALVSDLISESDLLRGDVAILRRCFSFFERLKVNRQVRPIG